METREQRQTRAAEQNRDRAESKRLWMEGLSAGLDNAWVSVCPHAQTHEVCSYRLVDVIDVIGDGCSIHVPGKYGKSRAVNIEEHQDEVQRLYHSGVKEAQEINRVRIIRLLETMSIEGVAPEEVEPVLDQPKKNVKLFYVTALKFHGKTVPVTEPNVVWHPPSVLGKARANEAKKWGPAVCLGGLFLPHRDGAYLIRASGLFPIDVDGFESVQDREDKRREIAQDEHVAILFASITGSGLRACILGEECKTATQYERLYRIIAKDKAKKWSIQTQIDEQTCDISRLCFIPYDDSILYQP